MPEMDDALAKATAQANGVFEKMRSTIEEETKRAGATHLQVLDIARKAGLQINEQILEELHIDPIIPIHPWLPWHYWWPWRPLWCWWWHRQYPWYRCCPYWWYRCHWYPL